MKPVSLYNTVIELENGDVVAVKEKRAYIRDGDNIYVSCKPIESISKLPNKIEVNSAGRLSVHEEYLPKGLEWKTLTRMSIWALKTDEIEKIVLSQGYTNLHWGTVDPMDPQWCQGNAGWVLSGLPKNYSGPYEGYSEYIVKEVVSKRRRTHLGYSWVRKTS